MTETIIFKIMFVIACYLIGSVCFGYVFAKALKRKDFGKEDLPGAAGTYRQLGHKIGIATGFLDMAKGLIPILLAKYVIKLDIYTITIASLAIIVGHNWPIFFKFKGGGGLSTTIGVSLALVPLEFAIAFPVAVATGFIYKYTLRERFKVGPNPIGGGVGVFLLPILAFIFHEPLPIVILFICVFIIIVVKGIILYKTN